MGGCLAKTGKAVFRGVGANTGSNGIKWDKWPTSKADEQPLGALYRDKWMPSAKL